MNFWLAFWSVLFSFALIGFAVLAVIVTIGGAFEIRHMLRSLAGAHKVKEDDREAS